MRVERVEHSHSSGSVIWMRFGWYLGYLGGDITPLDAVGKPQILGNIYENPEIELLK